jgi:hypothetical protein
VSDIIIIIIIIVVIIIIIIISFHYRPPSLPALRAAAAVRGVRVRPRSIPGASRRE